MRWPTPFGGDRWASSGWSFVGAMLGFLLLIHGQRLLSGLWPDGVSLDRGPVGAMWGRLSMTDAREVVVSDILEQYRTADLTAANARNWVGRVLGTGRGGRIGYGTFCIGAYRGRELRCDGRVGEQPCRFSFQISVIGDAFEAPSPVIRAIARRGC